MEDKIKKYVEYHFRFKEGKEKEDLVEEVTSNLIDRFETLKEKYGDENKAYRETIARMGDFSEVETDSRLEYTIRPKLYDVGLVVSLTLAIFGLVSIFLQEGLAFILTVGSIVVFVASAYHSYHNALYEKNVNGDIDYFHLYLDKSFSYLKPAFIFWAITFSILLGQAIAGIFLFLAGAGDPLNAIANIGELVGLYFVSFMIATVIIGVLFYLVYNRIMIHYRYISGKDHLEGTLGKGLGMVRFNGGTNNDLLGILRTILPWFILLLTVLTLMSPASLEYFNSTSGSVFLGLIFNLISPRYYFTGILLLAGYVGMMVGIIKTIRNSSGSLKWLTITTFGLFAAYFLVMFIINELADSRISLYFTSMLNPLFLMLIGLVAIGIIQLVSFIYRDKPEGRD